MKTEIHHAINAARYCLTHGYIPLAIAYMQDALTMIQEQK